MMGCITLSGGYNTRDAEIGSATMAPSPATRPAWLDEAWGITVLLIALSYSMLPELLLDVVFIFTWPLAFFLAGLQSRTEPRCPACFAWRQRARRLLLPYAGWSLLAWGLWRAWSALGLVGTSEQAPGLALLGTLYAAPRGAMLAHARPLWALPALFLVQTLAHPLDTERWRTRWQMALIAALWLLGWATEAMGLRAMPWSLQSLPTLGAFYLLGRGIADWQALRISMPRLAANVLQYVFAGVVFAAAAWNGRADPALGDWGRSYPVFALGALTGIGAAYARAQSVSGLRLAAWAGRHWIALLAGGYPAILLVDAGVRACGATCDIPPWAAAFVGLAEGVLALALVSSAIWLHQSRPWSVSHRPHPTFG
jgi:fucose 4-O-acetylase-like acetyltransferase